MQMIENVVESLHDFVVEIKCKNKIQIEMCEKNYVYEITDLST